MKFDPVLFILTSAVVALAAYTAGTQEPQLAVEETATTEADVEVNNKQQVSETLFGELSQVYEEYRQACLGGDLVGYRRLRDDEQLARMERLMAERGRELTSEVIQLGAEEFQPIPDRTRIHSMRKGSWAQIKYAGGEAEPDAAGSRVFFHMILFHQHGPQWKVVHVGNVNTRQFDESGKPVTVDTVEIPDRLRIPEAAEGI